MADIQQMAPVMSDADREVARTLRREKVSRVVRYVVLIFVGLLMLYPLAWMFSASFKPNHEIFTTLGLWPAHATWDGFINGWKTGTEYHFGHYMLNTFKYVIPKVVLTIISSTIVAYGFARFEIPWKKFWFATLITTMLLPSTVLLIPQYLMFREMGMLNSYLPLYLPLAFATQGFFVFMLIQFLRGVPRDMERGGADRRLQLHPGAVVCGGADPQAGHYLGGAVPVYVVDERLYRSADLRLQRR